MKKREMLNGIVNRIKHVGIELEGGWEKWPSVGRADQDNSVKFKRTDPRLAIDPVTGRNIVLPGEGPRVTGEVVSQGPDGGGILPSEIEAFVTAAHPTFVNETCGLHVHMSFYYKLNYSRLLTPEFTVAMVDGLKQWGTERGIPEDHMFWKRLDPNHEWTLQHCSHTYLGDNQIKVRGKDYRSRGKAHSRYTAINYCEAQHHTVEVRLLPMFATAPESIAAIMAVLNITNRFLSKVRHRERVASVAVIARPAIYQEYGSIV
jgi:hypothetical protein